MPGQTEAHEANQQLQERLDVSEEKLESQTDQLSSYLSEARTDGLTGLLNRRAFDAAHDELFAKWRSTDRPYCVGLIDIDHFKQINDTYGHPAGDEVLVRVAEALRESLNSECVCVARYGGEEFGVLTTQPLDHFAKLMELTRQSISELEIYHEERTICVTISVGAAGVAGDDQIGNLVRRADEALYAAKLGGRNRLYIHDGRICRLITEVQENHGGPSNGQAVNEEHDEARSRVQQRLDKIVEEETRRVLEP